MRKINLVLLINSFNLGGAEKLIYDLALNYNKNKFNCHVVSMAPINSNLEKKISKSLTKKNIKIYSLNKAPKKDKIKCIIRLIKYLKKNKINILHTNGQSPDFYGRIASIFHRKCKVLVTIHNTSGYNKYIELLLQTFTHQYTAVSAQAVEYCEELLIKKDVALINNGINIETYSLSKRKNNKNKIILSVGRMVEQKGYIEIASKMNEFLLKNNNYDWYILGDNSDPIYKEHFFDKIDKDVIKRIHLIGVVTNAEEYYKKADYFLLNSKYEGFGIAIIEAIIAKLPVYVTNVGVVPDLLENGCKLNIINENYNLNFNKNKINYQDLEKNFEYVKSKYSLKSIANEYENLYINLLKNKKDFSNE